MVCFNQSSSFSVFLSITQMFFRWQGQLRGISTNIRYAAVRRRYRKFSFFLKLPFSRKTCYKGLQICIKIWQSHFVSWLFQILSLKGYDGLPWSTCCILFGRGGWDWSITGLCDHHWTNWISFLILTYIFAH